MKLATNLRNRHYQSAQHALQVERVNLSLAMMKMMKLGREFQDRQRGSRIVKLHYELQVMQGEGNNFFYNFSPSFLFLACTCSYNNINLRKYIQVF